MVLTYLNNFLSELVNLLLDMSPWLLLGFLIAGLLHVFFPDGKISSLLGKNSTSSVFNAAFLGIPLPLCSCGVIPTGVSFYKNGASKGSAVSFLISTPQTGVDSILVTYSLLGLPFAIIRPIVAFFTGIAGGLMTNFALRSEPANESAPMANNTDSKKNVFYRIFKYAFVDFLADIAKWIVIGLLVAALIAVFIPDDFFASYIHSEILGMLIVLAASVPIYVCATSSVPIAAVLLLKGLSPGAALVFLMAGPATNAATITVIGKVMGKKTLISYLTSIIAGALLFGLLIDYVLPRDLFMQYFPVGQGSHIHSLLPEWLKIFSGVAMVLFILNIYLRKWIPGKNKTEQFIKIQKMKNIKIKVDGMTCQHCKMNVENSIKGVAGVNDALADLDSKEVVLSGEDIDLEKVKNSVESIGYKYSGVIS